MKITKEDLIKILDNIEGDVVQFFPASIHYGASDPDAHEVARIEGIDQQGVFVRAA